MLFLACQSTTWNIPHWLMLTAFPFFTAKGSLVKVVPVISRVYLLKIMKTIIFLSFSVFLVIVHLGLCNSMCIFFFFCKTVYCDLTKIWLLFLPSQVTGYLQVPSLNCAFVWSCGEWEIITEETNTGFILHHRQHSASNNFISSLLLTTHTS